MARKRINKKVKNIVDEYITLLENDQLPLDRVFVFGSRVSGKARQDSDIDVAVVSPKLKNNLASTKYLLRKAHQLEDTDLFIEPHAFHTTEFSDTHPLAFEIKNRGVRIK